MSKSKLLLMALVMAVLNAVTIFAYIVPDRTDGEKPVVSDSIVYQEPENTSSADVTVTTTSSAASASDVLSASDVTDTTSQTTTTTTAAPTTTQTTATTLPSDPNAIYSHGDKHSDISYLQGKLINLGYLTGYADGYFGNDTVKAVRVFQQAAGLPPTGSIDQTTMDTILSPDAPRAPASEDHPDVRWPKYSSEYYIIVYRDNGVVLVLRKDDYGRYNQVIKTFRCSVGRMDDGQGTPAGVTEIDARYEWRELFGDSYAQYAVRFNGDILFHSVPYYSNSPDDLKMEEFEKLGVPASLGCVRLCVRDAKWIYDNAKDGTQVYVLTGRDGPTETEPIPELNFDEPYNGWDPTDPNPNSPYNQ